MVGFIVSEEEEEELNQASKLKTSKDPQDHNARAQNNLEFSSLLGDSFIDFDYIENWARELPEPDNFGSGEVDLFDFGECINMAEVREASFGETHYQDQILDGSVPFAVESCLEVKREPGSDLNVSGPSPVKMRSESSAFVTGLEKECGKDCRVDFSIVEEMGKFSLVGSFDELEPTDVNSTKESEIMSKRDESESTSECESESESEGESKPSSSSSSSTCSSSSQEELDDNDDQEDEKEKFEKKEREVMEIAGEVEEGEILEDDHNDPDMMAGSSDSDIDDEDPIGPVYGPIRSKNEVKFLPSVPLVTPTLESHHQTLPVGVIFSILEAQVIVEGAEQHSPLNEGSILWITERRSPLGLIDEIFGPVKNPYYVVRYNSEDEVPAGIREGTPISFVPEFAGHVLSNSDLYQKGYDASGENDEELSNEPEFSDDEKEAEYRRMLKMMKRGTSGQALGNRKKEKRGKNRNENRKHRPPSIPRALAGRRSSVSMALGDNNRSCFSGPGEVISGGPCLGSPFLANGGFCTNVMPYLQQQTAAVPNEFMPNIQWPQANQQQPPFQTPFPNGMDNMQWPLANQQQPPFQMPLSNGMPMFQQQQQWPQINQQQPPVQIPLPNGMPMFQQQQMQWPQANQQQPPVQMSLPNGMPMFQQQQQRWPQANQQQPPVQTPSPNGMPMFPQQQQQRQQANQQQPPVQIPLPNGMPFQQQKQRPQANQQQPPVQIPLPNGMPFQQQQQQQWPQANQQQPPVQTPLPNGMPMFPQQQQQRQQANQQQPSVQMPLFQQQQQQLWSQANQQQPPVQMPVFQQQFVPSQGLVPQFVVPNGQPNFIPGSPWPVLMGQNGFNQPTCGMGFQGQVAPPSLNPAGQNCNMQLSTPTPPGNVGPQQFHPGTSSSDRKVPNRPRGWRPAHHSHKK